MTQREVTVINATGLHARPASEFVTLAKTFSAQITIQKEGADGKAVNAKSILMVLAQGCDCGTKLTIAANGEDEQAAVDQLSTLLASGFGEA